MTRICVGCGVDFLVDTSRRCWWSKKFCDEDCRTKHQNKIRCHRAKTGMKSTRVVKPKIVLTEEQRLINEMFRRQRSAESRRGTKRTAAQKKNIAAGTQRAWVAGKYDGVDFSLSQERRKRISEGLIRAYQEGRVKPTGSYQNKWQLYDGSRGLINMRSKSETLFAYHLDSLDIEWQYEPKQFDLGWGTYTPDFYMPGFDRWIEVKGQWTDVSLQKFTDFQKTHLASVVLAKDLLRFEEKSEFLGKAGLSPTGRG